MATCVPVSRWICLMAPERRQDLISGLRDRIGDRRDRFNVYANVLSVGVVKDLCDVEHRGAFLGHVGGDRESKPSWVDYQSPLRSRGDEVHLLCETPHSVVNGSFRVRRQK